MVIKAFTRLICCFVLTAIFGPKVVIAQSITLANDGTGTAVSESSAVPGQFDITGGTEAGSNLFHSFEQFGLDQGQIANFLSNPDINNILGRVVGGDASVIDGLIQVSGGQSNLFLMNPAGIIFGENARLNVPADFTATTANGIQLDEYWFSAQGSNNYADLIGTPSGFGFTVDNPGAIVNSGELAVAANQSIQLIGGTVVNLGTLSTPGGNITVEAVPEAGVVTLTPEGNLLSLGLPVETQADVNGGVIPLTALALPELLSNSSVDNSATGITVEDGTVRLTRFDTVIPTDAGVAISSGSLNTTNTEDIGGNIDVLGDRVGLVSVNLDASGPNGGGMVRIGGDYQGNSIVSNAENTYIDHSSTIRADALNVGSGGQVIVWSDGTTAFYGEISAQGGTVSGDGGFVEVSGHQHLAFDGNVNVNAINGNVGTLLLDPRNILISNDSTSEGIADITQILSNASDPFEGEDITINADTLQQQTGNIRLEATNDIRIADGAFRITDDGVLSLEFVTGGSITFVADAGKSDDQGSFLVGDATTIDTLVAPDQTITAPGRDITISGASIVAGNIVTRGDENGQDGGDINLTSTLGNIIIGYIDASSGNFASDGESAVLGTLGGNIIIDANQVFRATGFIDSEEDNIRGPVSILSVGTLPGQFGQAVESGDIDISELGSDLDDLNALLNLNDDSESDSSLDSILDGLASIENLEDVNAIQQSIDSLVEGNQDANLSAFINGIDGLNELSESDNDLEDEGVAFNFLDDLKNNLDTLKSELDAVTQENIDNNNLPVNLSNVVESLEEQQDELTDVIGQLSIRLDNDFFLGGGIQITQGGETFVVGFEAGINPDANDSDIEPVPIEDQVNSDEETLFFAFKEDFDQDGNETIDSNELTLLFGQENSGGLGNSGSVGAIVSRNSNGETRAVYEDDEGDDANDQLASDNLSRTVINIAMDAPRVPDDNTDDGTDDNTDDGADDNTDDDGADDNTDDGADDNTDDDGADDDTDDGADDDTDDGTDDDGDSDDNGDSDNDDGDSDDNLDSDDDEDSDDDGDSDDNVELCESFRASSILDLSGVAPAECQEPSVAAQKMGG